MKKTIRSLLTSLIVFLCCIMLPTAHAANGLIEVTNSPDINVAAMNDRLQEDFWLICMTLDAEDSPIPDFIKHPLFTRENWREFESNLVNIAASVYDETDRCNIKVEPYTAEQNIYLRFQADPFHDFLKREYGIAASPKSNSYTDKYGTLLYKDGYYYASIIGVGIPAWSTRIDHVYCLRPNLYYVQFTETTTFECAEPEKTHSYAILHQDSENHYQLYECGKTESISPERLRYRLSAEAAPTSMRVTLDGSPIALEAYEIDGSNFVKLRDIAMLLNGTDKQFSVTYESAAKAISLTSGQRYVPVGGERKAPATKNKLAAPSDSAILLDGKELHLTAYAIDGNNFFKLRDLGSVLNFGVEWNSGTNTVEIVSRIGYDNS